MYNRQFERGVQGSVREMSLEERAERILRKVPLIDGHNDLPFMIRMVYGNHIYKPNFTFSGEEGLPGHVDLKRLRQGRVGGNFWSVFVPCPSTDTGIDGVEFSDDLYSKAVHQTFQQIDLVKRLVDQYSNDLVLQTSSDIQIRWEWHWERFYDDDEDQPKILSMIGAEGLHQIGNSPALLRLYYQLGVRYVTLTHGCNNKYADSATAAKPRWGGLSPDGWKIVKEMNRIGMMVDLSHVSTGVMRDVLSEKGSRAPVIFSHSSAYAICPHPRNVPDDVLKLVKLNKGIVMVNFYPRFVSCGPGKKPEDATLEMVADHIEHIGKLIGWDYVGLGSDFDGIESVPAGLEDVSKYPKLIEELLRRNVSDNDVEKVVGRNLVRVWEKVERVATQMRSVEPLEDEVPVKL
ncbi:renal dipeptidase family [Kalaharituber pfeilii]|nr:renal dipeptidase family [Kalaharituber pfeilii]